MAHNTAQRLIMFDGQKSIDLPQYPDEAWTFYSGRADSGREDAQKYYKAIPTLFRGVRLRALNVSGMPFAIVDKSGKDIDSSTDWQNKVGFLPNPKRLLYLIEYSMTLTGRAYQWRKFNAARTLSLRYLNPYSVTYEINQDTGELSWKRDTGHGPQNVEQGSIVYQWMLDGFVELGAPESYPGRAALMACGVLGNLDLVLSAFFKRGMIKPTIFAAGGMPESERDRFQNWFKRFAAGVKNAFETLVINGDKMTPVVIGEGLKELENQTLTEDKRKDIAMALEIPYSILFSDSARGLGGGGVSEQDDLNFLEDTVIPESELIAEYLTEQVFEPLGYRMQIRPEGLTAMQEDENARASAFGAYVAALEKPEEFLIAADILGIDLDEEIEAQIRAMIKAKADARAAAAEAARLAAENAAKQPEQAAPTTPPASGEQPAPDAQAQEPPPAKSAPDPIQADLQRWQRKALKAVERGKPADVAFDSDVIPLVAQGEIHAALARAATVDDVRAVFGRDWGVKAAGVDGLVLLAAELRRANDLLEATVTGG